MEELSKKVIDYHAKKYEKVRKGIGDIMCGPMIETDVDVLVKKIEEKKTNESVRIMLKDNLPDEMIIRYSGISPEGLAKLKEEIRTEQT